MNTPFQVTVIPTTELPLWKQREVIDLARSLAWPLGAVLFAALVLLGLVRPALKSVPVDKSKAAPVPGAQLDALEAEMPERPALPSPTRKTEAAVATPEQLRLEDARILAKENPTAVANILKIWLNGEVA
jgi:flagellar M-ring protein FliF